MERGAENLAVEMSPRKTEHEMRSLVRTCERGFLHLRFSLSFLLHDFDKDDEEGKQDQRLDEG